MMPMGMQTKEADRVAELTPSAKTETSLKAKFLSDFESSPVLTCYEVTGQSLIFPRLRESTV